MPSSEEIQNRQARNNGRFISIALYRRKRAAPRRQFLYLVNNYICLKTQNDNGFHLSAENQEQLESFLKLLNNPEPSKKRKAVDFLSTP